jgi:hypothetical protein
MNQDIIITNANEWHFCGKGCVHNFKENLTAECKIHIDCSSHAFLTTPLLRNTSSYRFVQQGLSPHLMISFIIQR